MKIETDVSRQQRIGEPAETGHSLTRRKLTRRRLIDYAVVTFVLATLVLMPLLSESARTTQDRIDRGSFSTEARQALTDSRGDAAASAAAENAAAENAAGDTVNSAQKVIGANGEPVGAQIRNAIEDASRGDAPARGSVASDYNEAGGSY